MAARRQSVIDRYGLSTSQRHVMGSSPAKGHLLAGNSPGGPDHRLGEAVGKGSLDRHASMSARGQYRR
jgi:hypothetical protein